ncbi:hypothetical protein B6I21_00875 [candidate division KSB1 bacterium 4572_119]|nr:MAG: hypothetical protein B6I21_00875 [candidate division KSB1 bacterium 4572_119]
MEKALNVIIVKESDDDVLVIERELRNGGFKPNSRTVKTFEQMNKALEENSYDIVIADNGPSEFSGLDALKILKEQGCDIPSIIVLEDKNKESIKRAKKAGARDYISKDNLIGLGHLVSKEIQDAKTRKQQCVTNKTLNQDNVDHNLLFDESPIPLWLEDMSGIQEYIDSLKKAGVSDFKHYFDENPKEVDNCLKLLKIVDVNKEALKLIDASDKDSVINNPQLLFEQISCDIFKKEVISLAEGKLKFECEVFTKTLSGQTRVLLLKLSVMPGSEKKLSRVLIAITDITDKKWSGRENKTGNQEISNSLSGIAIEDLRGNITYVNKTMLKMWGYNDEDEIIGKNGIRYWLDKEKAKEVHKLTLKEGVWDGELTGLRKDGSTFEVNVATTLIHNEDGNPLFLMGSFEDKTERRGVEKAVREREELFHALFEKNQAVILLLDVDDKDLPIVDVNEAAVNYYGYQKEDLLNKSIMDLNILDANEAREKMAEARRRNKTVIEFKHRLADGTIRDVETYSGPIDVYDRKLVYVVVQDITDRKRTKLALQESEEQFRTIYEHAPMGIAMISLEYKYLKANRAYCQTLGYTEKELKRLKFTDITHPYDLEKNVELQQKLLSGSIPHFELEKRYIQKDGSIVYGILRVSLIKDSDGSPIYFLGQLMDITERKRAEEALRESEERYRNLAENSPNAIVVHSEGKVVFVNNEAIKIMGGKNETDLMGLPVTNFVHPNFENIVSKRIKHLYSKKGNVALLEEKFIRLDGTMIDVEVAGADVNYKGKPASQVVFRDITYRKRAEMVQELLYWISNAVFTSENLNDLFKVIRTELSKVLDTTNFSIALYDKETDLITSPFCNDKEESFKTLSSGKTLISYVIKNNEPLQVKQREIARLIKRGEIERIDNCPKIWLGVPLIANNEVIGAMVVQSYNSTEAYGIEELEILKFTSHQIGLSIERKQAESKIKSSLDEKIVLLKEIHHRVKNNLQVISSLLYLQSKYLKDKTALTVFQESQNRVRSMSLVHEKLYQSENFAKINLKQYIEDLAKYLFRSYNIDSNKIRLDTKIDKVVLDIERAIPCGLIINELVTNSLKYAFPNHDSGKVTIRLKACANDKLSLTVKDDGIGLQKYMVEPDKKSLGLQLVDTLIDQLQGTLKIGKEKGADFKISFPKFKIARKNGADGNKKC